MLGKDPAGGMGALGFPSDRGGLGVHRGPGIARTHALLSSLAQAVILVDDPPRPLPSVAGV
jgi:hypothetical protein